MRQNTASRSRMTPPTGSTSHGISPADVARVLIAVGISRLRASLPPDELKAELYELAWQILQQAENRFDQGHDEGNA